MMTIHLLLGIALVGVTIAAIVALVAGRSSHDVDTLARWAIGLLVIQVSTGVFLLTAGDDGPGLLHVVLPLIGLVVAFAARGLRQEAAGWALLGSAYVVVALASVTGLLTGLGAG